MSENVVNLLEYKRKKKPRTHLHELNDEQLDAINSLVRKLIREGTTTSRTEASLIARQRLGFA
jgi:hypothetical protein